MSHDNVPKESEMSTRKITAFAATAAVALSGAAPAISMATAQETGKHPVTAKSTYVYVKAGVGFSGTMFKNETFKVKRFSPSGKWAYGMAYGHVNRHVWIASSALAK
jgi:hypothetical protein